VTLYHVDHVFTDAERLTVDVIRRQQRPSDAELPISTFCHIDDVFTDAERHILDVIPRRQRPSDAELCVPLPSIYLPIALPLDVLARRPRPNDTAHHSSIR
jgi:hypothetical protein